jgi:hypothetical protein
LRNERGKGIKKEEKIRKWQPCIKSMLVAFPTARPTDTEYYDMANTQSRLLRHQVFNSRQS